MSRKRNHHPRIYQDRSQFKAGPSYLLQGLLIQAGYVKPYHDRDKPATQGWMNQQLAKAWGWLKTKFK